MRSMGRRIATATAALMLLASLQGCVFLLPDSFRAMSEFRRFADVIDQTLQLEGPEIDVILNAAGGDAISVYLPVEASKRFRIAEATARLFGVVSPVAEQDPLERDTATVQLKRRLVVRDGEALTLSFDTSRLSSIVHAEGYEGYYLFLCHPAVNARLSASIPPDLTGDYSYCYHGSGWTIVDEEVRLSLTLQPETSYYLAYLAGVILGVVVLGGIAWLVGDKLRQGPFRRRNAGSVALGLIVGILFGGAGVGAIAAVGAGAGPADNLALAKDIGIGLYALSVGLPALAGATPGIIFAMLLVRRRPWPDDPEIERFHAWPAPPPPGGPESPPPPPIPFGVR